MTDTYLNIAITGWIVTGLFGVYASRLSEKWRRRRLIARDVAAYWQQKHGEALVAFLEADMDRRLARRREGRTIRSNASRKGWQTRRERAA